MRNLNGKLQRLEGLAQSLFNPEPAYSADALNTWRVAVEFSDLVHAQFGGDRQAAVDNFSLLPQALRLKLNAFDWCISAHLASLIPDDFHYYGWRDDFQLALAGCIDHGFENGASRSELERSEALTEALSIIQDCLKEWQKEGA